MGCPGKGNGDDSSTPGLHEAFQTSLGDSAAALPRSPRSRGNVLQLCHEDSRGETMLVDEVTASGISHPTHWEEKPVQTWLSTEVLPLSGLARDMTFPKTLVICFDNPFVGINALLSPQPQGHRS